MNKAETIEANKTKAQKKDYMSAICLLCHNKGAGGVDSDGGAIIPLWNITNNNEVNRNKRFNQMLVRSTKAVGNQFQ